MDASQIEKMKALALAATKGPWHWVNPEDDQPREPGEWRSSLRTVAEFPVSTPGWTLPKFIVDADCIGDENMDANASFIAECNPAAVLELIAKLERAERALARGGFEDLGGQEWKPPLGQPPRFIEVPAPASGTEKDAARYRWISARTEKEGRDGGWIGYFRLPMVDGWNDTPYAAKRKEAFHYSTLDEAIDAAIAAHTKAGKPEEQQEKAQ
jgi:hypothetical protein